MEWFLWRVVDSILGGGVSNDHKYFSTLWIDKTCRQKVIIVIFESQPIIRMQISFRLQSKFKNIDHINVAATEENVDKSLPPPFLTLQSYPIFHKLPSDHFLLSEQHYKLSINQKMFGNFWVNSVIIIFEAFRENLQKYWKKYRNMLCIISIIAGKRLNLSSISPWKNLIVEHYQKH